MTFGKIVVASSTRLSFYRLKAVCRQVFAAPAGLALPKWGVLGCAIFSGTNAAEGVNVPSRPPMVDRLLLAGTPTGDLRPGFSFKSSVGFC